MHRGVSELKILLYCKNTEAHKRALDIALEQAKAFGASVDLVSCVSEKDKIPLEVMEKAEKKLQDYAEEVFAPASIPCTTKVIVSAFTSGEELVKYAEANSIDTIIMSIQKRSRLGKIFYGSNTQYVLLEAPCKVITIT
jgi:nucleotide-binding universal stress UspA family protein